MKHHPKPAKMGRPPLPDDQVRSKRIVTFVTRSEFEKLEELAADNSASLSSACYQIISEHLEDCLSKPEA